MPLLYPVWADQVPHSCGQGGTGPMLTPWGEAKLGVITALGSLWRGHNKLVVVRFHRGEMQDLNTPVIAGVCPQHSSAQVCCRRNKRTLLLHELMHTAWGCPSPPRLIYSWSCQSLMQGLSWCRCFALPLCAVGVGHAPLSRPSQSNKAFKLRSKDGISGLTIVFRAPGCQNSPEL